MLLIELIPDNMPRKTTKYKKSTKKSVAGRKLFDGKREVDVVKKLEEAFALGCTDDEACFYADISRTALYNYSQKNPQFLNRKEQLKLAPILLARQTIVKSLNKPAYGRYPFLKTLSLIPVV